MNEVIEFTASTKEEWKSKIVTDLKGKPLDSLVWKSEVGPIDPVLFTFDESQQIPGLFPFQRGVNTLNNQWGIAVSVNGSDAKSANKKILQVLSEGANVIKIKNPTVHQLEELFDSVMLDIITLHFLVEAKQVNETESALHAYCTSKGYAIDELQLSVYSDAVAEKITTGKDSTIIDGGHYLVQAGIYAQGGGTIDHQIGWALAHGHHYLVSLIGKGKSPNEAAALIEFQLAIGTTYFLEIAKIRAFRALWAFVLSNYGVAEEQCKTKIHAQTSNFYFANLDVHTNLLRATTEAMAAVIAGSDTLEVLPYDINLEEENKKDDAQRLAINIQLILQEEAYLNQVVDAAGGSYYIESITEKLKEKGYVFFQKIEEQGGVLAHFNSGQLIEVINQDLENRKTTFKEGKTVLVGVNKFPNAKEVNKEKMLPDFRHEKVLSPIRLSQL